jgi:hypothetical protein
LSLMGNDFRSFMTCFPRYIIAAFVLSVAVELHGYLLKITNFREQRVFVFSVRRPKPLLPFHHDSQSYATFTVDPCS